MRVPLRCRDLSTTDRTLFIVLGTALKAALELLVGITLARALSQADFGSYRQFLLIFGTLMGLSSLGLPASLLYFVPRHANSGARRYVFRSFALILGATISTVLVACLLGRWIGRSFSNPDLPSLLIFGSLYPVGLAVGQCLPFLLISLNRHLEAAAANILVALFQGVPVVVLAMTGSSLRTIVLVMGLTSCLILVLTFRIASGLDRGPRLADSFGVSRTLLGYSLPLGINSMLGMLNQRLDRFLVSFFFSPAVLAVYSVGALEIPLVDVLPYTVGRVLIPRFVEFERAGRTAEILRLWHRSIIKVGLLVLPIFCICFAAAPELIAFLYGDRYVEAARIFRIYLLLLPLRLTSYGAVLQALGDTGSLLRGGLGLVVISPVLGITLTHALGWSGPAIAAVATQAGLILYLLNRIRVRLRCSWRAIWPWTDSLKLLGSSLGAVAAGLVVAQLVPIHYQPLLTGGLAFLTSFVLLAHFMNLIDREDWSTASRWFTLRIFS